VTPDGQRFLVNVVEQAALPPPITVITNWMATLRWPDAGGPKTADGTDARLRSHDRRLRVT